MKVEVVGTGCATCKQLYEVVKKSASDVTPAVMVEYIANQDGMKRLAELGLMRSPALVINGKVVMTGYSPDVSYIKSLIIENQ